jgi:hypothetical protein
MTNYPGAATIPIFTIDYIPRTAFAAPGSMCFTRSISAKFRRLTRAVQKAVAATQEGRQDICPP